MGLPRRVRDVQRKGVGEFAVFQKAVVVSVPKQSLFVDLYHIETVKQTLFLYIDCVWT